MTVYINENDVKLFQDNGFNYDDINNTVEHYRSSGLKDNEIQEKINKRITEFNANKNAQNSNNSLYAKNIEQNNLYPNATISKSTRNPLTDFTNCLKWVGYTTFAAYQEGNKQTEIADLEAKDMFHTINPTEKARLNELSNMPSKNYKDYGIINENYFQNNAGNFIPRMQNKAKKAYVEAINMLPYMWETIKAGGIGAGVGAAAGGAIGAGRSLLTTKADVVPSALTGAKIGSAWGSRITGSLKIAELEGGLARNELKQINQEIIEKGGEPLSEAMIDTLAVSTGAVNAGLEMIGLKEVLKTVPGGNQILDYLKKKNLRELASNKVLRNQLQNALGQYAKAVATEMSTEMLQETTNIIADETAKNIGKIQDKSVSQMLKDNTARILDTGKATFGATMFIGGAGTGAKAVSIMIKQGIPKNEAKAVVETMSQDEKQEYVEENFDTLMEIAKDKTVTGIPRANYENLSEDELDTELKREEIEEKAYNTLLKGRVSEDVAAANAKLVGQFFKKYGAKNEETLEKFNKWFEKLEVQYNVPVGEIGGLFQNKEISKEDKIEYQKLNGILQERLPNYNSIEEFYRDYSIIDNLTKNGATINSDGTVTLYHAGNIKDILKDGKFKATTAAKGGMTGYNSKSVFFGFDKEYVKKWSSNGTREITEIKVPFEYIKQAAQNKNEVYLDGDVVLADKEKNIWMPQDKIQDNFYTQLPALKAKAKLNGLFKKFNKKSQEQTEIKNISQADDITKRTDKTKEIQNLQTRAKELNINSDTVWDNEDKLIEEYKNELLDDKEWKLREQGYSHSDITEELADYENEAYKIAKEKVNEWYDNVSDYILDYAKTLAEYCESKGYLTEINKSKQSLSTYIKLYENEQQKEDNDPVKEIRISDHENNYADKDVMINYVTDINKAIRAIDEEIENNISEEFIKDFKGFSFDKSKIDKELNFTNLTVPEIQTKIKNYYDKYYKSNSESPYKKVFQKEGIGELSFSRQLERNLKNKRDFEIAQILLSNMEEIIDKGDILTKSKTEKIISTPILFKDKNSLFKFDLPVNIDSNGNWIIDVNKIKISPDAVANNTRTFRADTNIIPQSEKNITPDENSNKQKLRTFFQSAYTGSAVNYEKPSLKYIGTGEGAQAHGWGLYYSKEKHVAEGYRNRLRGIEEQTLEGANKILNQLNECIEYTRNKKNKISEEALEIYNSMEYMYENKNDLIADLQESIDKQKEHINHIKQVIKEKGDNKSQVYKVDIPENDVLLDENKPFSEQPEKVQGAIAKLFNDLWNIDIYNSDKISSDFRKPYNELTGGQLYREIDNVPEMASKTLNKYGIKGITYDGKQDGRCYVIFDDEAINVLKTYYQESDNEPRIAGYTYNEVGDKLASLYEERYSLPENDPKLTEVITNILILEDAYEAKTHPEDYDEDKISDIMMNAYYIMNDQEIPQAVIEQDRYSKDIYNDLKKLHEEKKEEAEREYLGYFIGDSDKNVITIMSNSNASTALHELGHLFLNGLNELAKVNEEAREQLNEFNKWLGYTGGEYTIVQQEKFARSFEAYLYKGKAPNNKLRTVFENFKEWLKSVYEYIVDIKGADISDEVQEMFDKMFSDDGYYQEKKEADKFLKDVKEKSKRKKVRSNKKLEGLHQENTKKTKEQEELAKRHKDISYDILSVASGKSVKYLKSIFETDSDNIATAKKRDRLAFELGNTQDEIKISDGMRDEWLEFYSDTGVSYNNAEIGGDYELAMQAFNTILNKNYGGYDLDTVEEERANYYEQAIDEADRQYKFIIDEFRKAGKTNNFGIPKQVRNDSSDTRNSNTEKQINYRNVVLSAFYDWVEGLDKEIKKDYENRFIYDTGIIERNENLNKFEKAKQEIIKKALSLENKFSINSNEKYREVVKEIMKNLNFLSPQDKAKLTVNILDYSDINLLMGRIDSIMDIAKTMEDIQLRRNLERDIHSELQKTKNIKKSGRTVGKYDYRTNKLFEELRELDKLSPERANELRLEARKFSTAEDKGMSYKDKIVNKFLSYKANGRTYADTDLMKELYDEILKIKLIGKSAKSELELMEKLGEGKDIEELIKIVEKKKEAGKLVKNYVSMIGNLESTINAIFGNKIKEKYASEILYAETQAQAWQYRVKSKFEENVAKIYKLPLWMWDKKIIDYLSEKHTYTEIRRKYNEKGELIKARNIDRTLTKMDIIQAYIWSKNEVLEKRLINQFGEETLENMFDELSNEDVQLAELLIETASSFYPMVNKAFIQKYGLDLPKVSCYFPSTPERGSEVDLYNEYSSKSLNNSFTKQRAQSEIVPMDFHNPITTLYSHIDGVAKFAFMSESLDKANLRFKDTDLKRVIINKFGEDVYRTLEQCLINVTYKKEAAVFNGMNKIIDNMVGNWIQANVAIKPIVGLKQLLSANNYAVDMPYMAWQKGFLKALAHPVETIDYMMKIPYIEARFKGNFSNEFLKQQIENSAFATSKKLKDLCTLFVKIGDIGAIIFGGKPYIDYQINQKGLTKEEAIKQFILSTNRSQQSSAVSSLSNFQVDMTRNPFGKLLIAFKNSPQQYIRMCGDAIISATNGDISKKHAAKLLFQFGYLQPLFYAVATSGSLLRWLFADDDEDLLKDLSVSLFNLGSDALPIIGDIYKYTINKMLYKEKNLPATTPLLGDIEKEINRISKEDVTVKDYLESIGYLGLHVGLGYNSKAIGNTFSGVGDIFTGEPVQGTMKVLGYTKKRAEHIAGND